MGPSTSAIDKSVTDPGINAMLALPDGAGAGPVACRYSQNEDQFAILDAPFEVPALPIHHGFQNPVPPAGYVEALASVVRQVASAAPWLLGGTRWFFDPVNILAPAFFRVARFGDRDYLYLARLDLACRPLESEILEPGGNSRTHRYRTAHLYYESDWYPLAPEAPKGDRDPLEFDQIVPVTWKGESGEGYMIHGIWMDSDINKFFSKLVLPAGARNHPFYPVTCKHRCVSLNALGLEPSRNGRGPGALHGIREWLEPELDSILQDLQAASFSELMPLFKEIKARVPAGLGDPWSGLRIVADLNERDQKEYTVEF